MAVRGGLPAARRVRHHLQLSRLSLAGAAVQPQPGDRRRDLRDLPDRYFQFAVGRTSRRQARAAQGAVDDAGVDIDRHAADRHGFAVGDPAGRGGAHLRLLRRPFRRQQLGGSPRRRGQGARVVAVPVLLLHGFQHRGCVRRVVLRVARLEWRRGVRRRDGVAGIADRARLVPPAAAAAKHRDAADTDEPGRDARTQPSPARPVPLEPRAASCEHWWLRSADGARLSRTHRGGRGMTSFLSVFNGARTFLRSGSIAVAAGLLVMLAGAANAQTGISRGDRYAGQPWATRSPVLGQHGMIASEQPLASRVGIEILKKGGSAFDAAIATSAMLCLTEPVLNGMGADAFVIVYDPKTRKLYGYNGSGWSPKGRSLKSMQAQVKAAYEQAGMQPTDQI